jgi:hypothetical protein
VALFVFNETLLYSEALTKQFDFNLSILYSVLCTCHPTLDCVSCTFLSYCACNKKFHSGTNTLATLFVY